MANRPLRLSLCALTLSSLLGASPAAAQNLPALTETQAHVHVRFRSGAAEVEVTRTFYNPASEAQELVSDLSRPQGGALVALSTNGKEGDLVASLVPNQLAREAYEEATGFRPGLWNRRDPAVAVMDPLGEVTIQVFPVAPDESRKVSYRWLAPTLWTHGADVLELPYSPEPYTLVVDAEEGAAFLETDAGQAPAREGGDTVSKGVTIRRVRGHFAEGVSGIATVLPLSQESGRAWLRAHFDLAPKLEATPTQSALVVVVDVSRSMSDDDEALAEKLADVYIEQHQRAGTTRVSLLAFDRKLYPWTPGLVSPESARQALAKGFASSASRAHGSNLDEALRLAASWLDAEKDDVEKRILVLSDGKLSRTRMSSLATLPRHTVLHAVRFRQQDGESAFVPETGPLQGLTDATGGLSWLLRGDAKDLSNLGFQVDALVRSGELLDATLRAPGLVRKVGFLPEGEGVTLDEALPALGCKVVLEGRLWSRPFRLVAKEDPGELSVAAALASISAARANRSRDEVKVLARLGGAVSESTALLALEPGARAGRHGVQREPDLGIGFLGQSSWDTDAELFGLEGIAEPTFSTTSMFFPVEGAALSTTGEGSGPGAERTQALTAALRRAAAACDAHGPLSARVEATGDEIVNVEAEPCLAEALWQATIPVNDAPEHAVTSVSAAVL